MSVALGRITTDAPPPVEATPPRAVPTGVKVAVDLESPWSPEDQILEEFEFDHEKTWRFVAGVEKCQTLFQLGPLFFVLVVLLGILRDKAVFAIPFIILVLALTAISYVLADVNSADDAYCRWVAVSRDNVYIIRKKRKRACRFSCQEIGTSRKTIPIANIQDCMVHEPAGTAVMCFIPNVLTTVQIQTAASGGAEDPRADSGMGFLAGLEDPKRFRDVVMGLKKGKYTDPRGNIPPWAANAPPALTPSVGPAMSGAAGLSLGAMGGPAVSSSVESERPLTPKGDRKPGQKVAELRELKTLLQTRNELYQSIDAKMSRLPAAVAAGWKWKTPQASWICPNCGNLLDMKYAFCSACGTKRAVDLLSL